MSYIENAHTDTINTVCKLDDNTVVSGSNDRFVKVWDIKTRECLFTLNTGGFVLTLCTLPDGRIVSGGLFLKVFEKKEGNYIEKQYGEEESRIINSETLQRSIKSICALPDNKYIVSAPMSVDTILDIWNIDTGEHIRKIKTEHTGRINSVCILMDMYIVTASSDGIVKLWNCNNNYDFIDSLDASMYQPFNSNKLIGAPVYTVCELPDGKIATGSGDEKIRVWNGRNDEGENIVQIFEGHALGIMSVCTFTDNYIISGSNDETVKMWDIERGIEVLELQAGAMIQSVCVLGDHYIVAGLTNNNLIVWELKKNYTLKGGLRKLRRKRKTKHKQRILLNKTRNLKRK